ncbi:MAG: hypothetical protein VKI81_11360 [Synechococcaceae cyanobacterium]|nr:hypothetical protein [Synechococcaceae cyanobacterium]
MGNIGFSAYFFIPEFFSSHFPNRYLCTLNHRRSVMLQKVMLVIFAVLLILSLSSLLADNNLVMSSTDQQAEIEGQIQQTQNVSEMRTVTIRGTLKMRPTRNVQAVQATARDANAGDATGRPTVQSRQGERIFQQPLPKRTNQLNHKNVQESPATLD